MVQHIRSSGRPCLDRIWLRATAPSSCINEHKFFVRANQSANGRCNGCYYTSSRNLEQYEYQSSGENDSSYVIFHIGVLVSCCITLLVMCDYKHDSSYVWTNVTPNAGWSPPGWSFLFGFLSVSWTMTDYDATAHITEEIRNPELKAPWSITIALAFTYIGGWLFTICWLLSTRIGPAYSVLILCAY